MQGLIDTDILLNIANAIRNKIGGSATYTPAQMAAQINIIDTSDVSPKYHWNEVMRVAAKINDWKKEHSNSLIFGAISDHHVTTSNASYNTQTMESIRRGVFGVQTVAQLVDCDFIISLGDYSWENGMDTAEGYANAQFVDSVIGEPQNLLSYRLVGNHDRSSSTNKTYSLIGSHNDFDETGYVAERGFGYKDFTDKKVRVIFLNTTDYLNNSGGHAMSYDQKDFLIRALALSKIDYQNWQILLLSHIPLDFSPGDYDTAIDLNSILYAYTAGSVVDIAVDDRYALNEDPTVYETYYNGELVKSYAGLNAPQIIANIHGHTHNDVIGEIGNTGIKRISTPNSCFYLNKTTSYPDNGDYGIDAERGELLAKEANSAKDTSAVFYCIDLSEKTIYAFAYGAGVDRQESYSEITYSITYNLTQCTSSNNTSEVSQNSTFRAVLSPTDIDGTLSNVTVTMGGIDITSSCYNNGIILIQSVTDNVVITATASIPHWEQTVSDMCLAPRSVWYVPAAVNSSGPVTDIALQNSNTEAALGVSTANDNGRTDRESNQIYFMPIPTKASKVTVNTTDNTLDMARFVLIQVNSSTYTKKREQNWSNSLSFSVTPGQGNYIIISLRRSDEQAIAWGYNDSQVSVKFSND